MIKFKSIARKVSDSFRNSQNLHSARCAQKLGYQHCFSEELFLRDHLKNLDEKPKISVDIGCGFTPRNPFSAKKLIGFDLKENVKLGVIYCDILAGQLPLADSSIDVVTAFDFLEHIPRVLREDSKTCFPFIRLMDEIHRILRPGGIFYHRTPAFPFKEAFQDPTHVNIIKEDTFPLYFCSNGDQDAWASIYGFAGSFTLVEQAWIGQSLLGIMRANKNVSKSI